MLFKQVQVVCHVFLYYIQIKFVQSHLNEAFKVEKVIVEQTVCKCAHVRVCAYLCACACVGV